MRKLFFLFAIIISCYQLPAQDSANLPKIQMQIDSLQKRLVDANYTRIPKQDFEKILKNSVENEVSDSIKKWIAFLGTMIGLIGFLIAAFFKSQIKAQVEESYKNVVLPNVTASLAGITDKAKYENERQDKKLAELTERIDNLLANQTKFVNDSSVIIDKKIKDILSFAWDDIAEAKLRIAKEKNYSGIELIQEIKSFLENKEIEMRTEKRIALIDVLMRCYYQTSFKSEQEKYKFMIQLLRKYETDYELLPETYANAAIALSSSYEQYGIKEDRDTCIDSCDKSVSRLKDYGEPYAIKLEVFMMDYKKAYGDKERDEATENIKRTFNSISNNKSKVLCVQIIDRLERDSTVPYLKEYYTKLEKKFPDSFVEMKERVCSDILADGNYFNQDWHTKMVEDILQDHMLKSPNPDGNWTCTKLIKSGNEIDPKNDFELININGTAFTLTRNKIEEKGLLHFLPYSNMLGLNFYIMDKDILVQIIPGIYKMENDQLVICLNDTAQTRPEDFLSTTENQFLIVYYNKSI
jgi:uncharacterized protein (TIGR03067 family)